MRFRSDEAVRVKPGPVKAVERKRKEKYVQPTTISSESPELYSLDVDLVL